ncbi:hypothetical protein RR48_13732 [Papilio machaon]|uniref:Uncharacterized protein n=1 Tax=Papilio machaon TaxID=76193 RepID=A0A194RLL5_PAPMA|nr:hypothetical protein RR48_13732 [Papilio machaon]
MSCGKRPLVKNWDKPKTLKVIKPSRYEQNEASVKMHWKNVIRNLEASYKDEQFWESQYTVVRDLLDPIIFHRITKIFNLPSESKKYEPPDVDVTPIPSEQFFEKSATILEQQAPPRSRITFSVIDFQRSLSEGYSKEQSDHWTETTHRSSEYKKIRSKSSLRSKTSKLLKTTSKSTTRLFPKFASKMRVKSKDLNSQASTEETLPESDEDLRVHPSEIDDNVPMKIQNPHFYFLYCNESEADMITWNSKFKQKGFEVSASDQFNKKAEIATKKIATEFYEWWSNLGTGEYKSEIKRPEDIEDLFQVWFDEHASRGLVLDPKILPCVNQSIADYVGVPKASCPKALKRQIMSDIIAESSPAHTTAFATCLPQHMKHIPPKNNTKKIWQNVQIPDDLKTMSCVWSEIQHLTSTKTFYNWLKQRPHMPMPPCLESLDQSGEKKQLFVVPSDFVVKEKSSTSIVQELAFPVSEFTLELKEELSKILNE